jgi:hypothetical protein
MYLLLKSPHSSYNYEGCLKGLSILFYCNSLFTIHEKHNDPETDDYNNKLFKPLLKGNVGVAPHAHQANIF